MNLIMCAASIKETIPMEDEGQGRNGQSPAVKKFCEYKLFKFAFHRHLYGVTLFHLVCRLWKYIVFLTAGFIYVHECTIVRF